MSDLAMKIIEAMSIELNKSLVGLDHAGKLAAIEDVEAHGYIVQRNNDLSFVRITRKRLAADDWRGAVGDEVNATDEEISCLPEGTVLINEVDGDVFYVNVPSTPKGKDRLYEYRYEVDVRLDGRTLRIAWLPS